MRLRWSGLLGSFVLFALAVTVLSACAGAPPSLAGILGGLGGGLGVGLIALLLSATQPACGDGDDVDFCLSVLRDAGPRDAGVEDTGVDDAGEPDGGPRDAAPCLRDAALDVERHFGVPKPEYLAQRADERREVIEDLKRRGVLPAEVADELEV